MRGERVTERTRLRPFYSFGGGSTAQNAFCRRDQSSTQAERGTERNALSWEG